MAKPPLSMKPTGWFQIAWSDEISAGDVHKMHYFGREMVAWRAQSGRLTVMDAYCEHLGAHLGFGGHVEGEVIECAFTAGNGTTRDATSASPTRSDPTADARCVPTPW